MTGSGRFHLALGEVSWSQDGVQDRQEEPQEAPRQPTWLQDGPTWLQDGIPDLLQNHKNLIEQKILFSLTVIPLGINIKF